MHEHVSQVAGTVQELSGERRLRMGGGNFGADILGGYVPSVGTAYGYAGIAAPDGGAGMGTTLTRVVVHIAIFWIVSIAVLILLHKLGFRFSLTVG